MHIDSTQRSIHSTNRSCLSEMAIAGNLRVVNATVVTPSENLPARSLPLTFFDVKWLRGPPPVQRVFLYRLDHQHHNGTVQQLVSDLRRSLSMALTRFYPLAGHVRLAPGTNRYELFYQPGDGVAFTAAEYDVHVDDLASCSDDKPVLVAELAPLVPPLPKGRAVLAVQATVLLGGTGLALGVTVHHSACDGASSTHFLHTWAAACAGADMPPPPVIDRTLIADPKDLYGIYSRGLPSDGAEIEFSGSSAASYPGDQLLATFSLSQELLRGVKDALAAEAARHGGATMPLRCSSLLAAYSFIWSCYCRARQRQSTMDDGDQAKTTYFLFSVDHRARLDPPVPKMYLGNCLGPAIAAARHDELAADSPGGLFAAFTAIADALEEAVGEGARERWDSCVERVMEAVKAGLLSVAGSPRFGVYDIDFGFGRPAKVDVVSVAKTGAMSMTEGRGGLGGVEVGISLPAAGMECFRRCFNDAMRVVGVQEGVY